MDQNQEQQTDSLNNLVKICNMFNILLGLVASMSTTPTYKEDNQALRDDGNNLIKYTFLTGCCYMGTINCCLATKLMIKKNVTLRLYPLYITLLG